MRRPVVFTEVIKMRVTPEQKARWVAAAEAKGLTLTGLIEESVEKELRSLQVLTAPTQADVEEGDRWAAEQAARHAPVEPEKTVRETRRAAAPQLVVVDKPLPENTAPEITEDPSPEAADLESFIAGLDQETVLAPSARVGRDGFAGSSRAPRSALEEAEGPATYADVVPARKRTPEELARIRETFQNAGLKR